MNGRIEKPPDDVLDQFEAIAAADVEKKMHALFPMRLMGCDLWGKPWASRIAHWVARYAIQGEHLKAIVDQLDAEHDNDAR